RSAVLMLSCRPLRFRFPLLPYTTLFRSIYAFSYGWYLESPVDPKNENTLIKVGYATNIWARLQQHQAGAMTHMPEPLVVLRVFTDRKSTRLNSSHVSISYAVFCLKKKKY